MKHSMVMSIVLLFTGVVHGVEKTDHVSHELLEDTVRSPLQEVSPCRPIITINQTTLDITGGVTLESATHYCVVGDLVFRLTGAALTIPADAHGVVLDFGGHVLRIGPEAKGVSVSGAQQVSILNGFIESANESTNQGIAIEVTNAARSVVIRCLSIARVVTGIIVDASQGVSIENSTIHDVDNRGIWIRGGSQGVSMEQVVVANLGSSPGLGGAARY